mgnify:FL=1
MIAVSKIDKYDKGIGEKLRGIGAGAMELELGCIAVLNRTQEEIDGNVLFAEMRQRERTFFQTNHAFDGVPKQYLGCEQLIKRLASIQQDRIRSTLPSIIDELRKQIKLKKQDLKQMPRAIESESECWAIYIGLLKKYNELISARVNGIYDNDLQMFMGDNSYQSDDFDSSLTSDHIAYEIHKKHKTCAETIRKLFSNFFSTKYREIILTLLDENAGVALPNFPSFSIIERLYRIEQNKFREPCETLIESNGEYFRRILIQLLNRAFANEISYKNQMLDKLVTIVLRTIDECEEQCRNDLDKMLEIEERVFTLNHYYMDTVNKIKERFLEHKEKPKPGQDKSSIVNINGYSLDLSDRSNEHQAALDVQIAVAAYCRVVEKRLIDRISQINYYWFITRCALILDTKLSSAFTSAILFEWMREPFEQQQRRERLKQSVESMEKALAMGQSA